jgi:hypothetical protein
VEEEIVKAYVVPHRRSRWLSSLGSAKRRRRFLDCLNHCADFVPRYARPLSSNADVVALLRTHGAPVTCYVVSDTPSLDGHEMPLDEAVVAAVLAGWGTLISCIPGRLACYIDESGSRRRSLLVRAAAEPVAAKDPDT